MFFGRSRQRKSYNVGTPEYNEWIEEDNTSDLEELYNRMKKAGFEGGPGINKDRWTYGKSVFDFGNLGGGAREISDAKLDELISLLDRLDREAGTDAHEDYDAVMKSLYNDNPTGIFNPADYMGKTVIEKDTDDDGDFDERITKEPSRQEE